MRFIYAFTQNYTQTVWVNSATAPSVCVCVCVCVYTWMGQMQRTHFTAGYTLYNCACDKK